MASGAAPQPPWDADGFGWWADQFKLQHGRAPTDADYAEFRLSWKLSGEGKAQWTDADWEAFYEARQLGLDKYLAQGIQFDGNWTGKQVLDAVKELNKQIIVLPSEIKPGYGGIQQPYFPPAMLVSQAYMWSKGALLDATATPTPNATPTPTSPSSKPTPTPNPNPNPKTKLFDDLNKTALGAAIFAKQPKLWDKLDIRIQTDYPNNAVSFPEKDGKYLIGLPPPPDPSKEPIKYDSWVAMAGHELFHAYQREIASPGDIRKTRFTDLSFEREAYIAHMVFEYEIGRRNSKDIQKDLLNLTANEKLASEFIFSRDDPKFRIYAHAPQGSFYIELARHGLPPQVMQDFANALNGVSYPPTPTPTVTPTETATPTPIQTSTSPPLTNTPNP